MRERMEQGKLYTDLCEGLPEERREAKRRMRLYNDILSDDPDRRAQTLKEMLGQAEGIWVEPPFYFYYGTHIFVGKGTYINFNCSFIDDGRITVGEGVLFGPSVTIATVGHPICPELRGRGYMYTAPVTIEDNVWISANVTICPA